MREKEKFHSGIFRRIWERTHLWLWLSSLALAHSAQNYMTSKGEQTHQSILCHQLCPPCPRHLSIQRQSEKYYLKHPKHLVLPGKKFIFSALEWFFRFKRKFCVCVCMVYIPMYMYMFAWHSGWGWYGRREAGRQVTALDTHISQEILIFWKKTRWQGFPPGTKSVSCINRLNGTPGRVH